MYPLVCEATAALQTASSPPYQGCRTGYRYWVARSLRSVGGDYRVYVTIYGPRRTERGWNSVSPEYARKLSAEITASVHALTEAEPVVQAPWRAVVKGRDEFFSLTAEEAGTLAAELARLAGQADWLEVAGYQRCAPYDVPGLFTDGGPLPAPPAPADGEDLLAEPAPGTKTFDEVLASLR
jgi:hypothetical protein